MVSSPPASEHIGFLSVLETSSRGFFGGLLILDRSGHPVEFHCTVPVHANRAQEILYGETLRSFLCGSQIAPALYKHKKAEASLLITDTPLLLSFAGKIDIPFVLLLDPVPAGIRSGAPNRETLDLDSVCAVAKIDRTLWTEKKEDNIRYAVQSADAGPELTETIRYFRKMIDLTEPFDRIYMAIKESQKGA